MDTDVSPMAYCGGMTTGARFLSAARSAAWVAITMVVSLANLVFSATGEAEPSPYLFLSLLGAFTVPFVLIWRRRFPEIVMVITVIAGALLTIGSSTAWVALGALYVHRAAPFRKDPWLWLGTGATTAVTYLAAVRDTSTISSKQSMTGLLFMEPEGAQWRQDLPWYTEAVITLILMAMVLGVATLTRARRRILTVEEAARASRAQTVNLTHELARYEERERIARELHDSLGSKLAAVSMLSGAVRAQSGDPHAVESHAEQLQHTAQEATSQMHEIVRTYRTATAPRTTMRHIDDLIADCLRQGMLIRAEIDLDTTTQASPAVDRAVFRVIQELTTNAAKHAPERMLTLHARGGPELGGVHIEAHNPIPATAVAHPSGGAGLIGAAERVEQLGGWITTSSAGGMFSVHAWIPWRAPADQGAGG